MVLVADALAANHNVWVLQAGRSDSAQLGRVNYVSYDDLASSSSTMFDSIIVVRAIKQVAKWREMFPHAQLFLWVHDYLPGKRRKYARRLVDARCRVIAVTHTHAGHTAAVLGAGFWRGYDQKRRIKPANWPVTVVYNPVPDDLTSRPGSVDVNKLVFCSAPRKGLGQTLQLFKAAKERIPALRLLLANPGYQSLDALGIDSELLLTDGVEILGALPRHQLLEHIRSALCVFMPQSVYPETFGLVFAEAHAVGTPVLACDLGAAPELLSREELTDGTVDDVVEKLANWSAGARPKVRLSNDMRLSSVVNSWLALLG